MKYEKIEVNLIGGILDGKTIEHLYWFPRDYLDEDEMYRSIDHVENSDGSIHFELSVYSIDVDIKLGTFIQELSGIF